MENMHTDVRVWKVMEAIVSIFLIKKVMKFSASLG